MSPEATIKQILADVRAFRGDAPLHDDISMVILLVR
jgi:serine phosphatase RsbU (regulator of sigma subunit)